MQYTINQFRTTAFKEVYQVYEVFQNFFGEDAVDLQGLPDDDAIANRFAAHNIPMREDGSCYEANGNKFNAIYFDNVRPFILVYWPTVKVTNEHNKSITIQDLYAKIQLDADGKIPTENRGFLLNRATYPMDQWCSDYMHSHISDIPKGNLEVFQTPCLGSGPIIGTINSLRTHISEGFDETRWMLFCHELSLYVTVESLKGVPYRRLENVHLNSLLPHYNIYNENYGNALHTFNDLLHPETLRDFILYYLHKGHLAVNYQNGEFKVGMSYFEYMIDISNSFIEYFNSHFDSEFSASQCFNLNILSHAVVAGNTFYDPTRSRPIPDVSNYVGRKVCTFKGRDVTLKIIGTSEEEPIRTTVLSHGLAMYILNNILKVINYRYTNEYTRQHCQNTAALPATTGQRVYYI